MNPSMEKLRLIMTACMEMMHDTAQWMDQAAAEEEVDHWPNYHQEWAEHAEELRGAAMVMQTWIEGMAP